MTGRCAAGGSGGVAGGRRQAHDRGAGRNRARPCVRRPRRRASSAFHRPAAALFWRAAAIRSLRSRGRSVRWSWGPACSTNARSWAWSARGPRVVRALMPLFRHATVVLDALAMSVVRKGELDQPVVMTPHAGEMAYLSGQSKEAVCEDPVAAARDAASRWNACVALKGGSTVIASPDGALWQFDDGAAGLATSGSGDTLAGLIGGLAARGLQPLPACAWGVAAHASAGAALSRRHGPLGYLARELAAELPASLHALSKRSSPR